MLILRKWLNLLLCVKNHVTCTPPPPQKTLLHLWKYPKSPWSRLHIYYAGPLFGRMYLIVVDAFSKWVKVAVTHTVLSEATTEGLHHMFATPGVQDTIVLDNGSCFTSKQFSTFCTRNNIKRVTFITEEGKHPIHKPVQVFSPAGKTTRKSSRKSLIVGQKKETFKKESHDNLDQLLNIDISPKMASISKLFSKPALEMSQ